MFQEQLETFLHTKLDLPRLSIKYQNKQLGERGEIVVKSVGNDGFRNTGLDPLALINASKQWNLSIERVRSSDNCLNVFLNREAAYRMIITTAIEITFNSNANQREPIYVTCDADDNPLTMTELRTISVRNVAKALLLLNGFDLLKEEPLDQSTRKLHVGTNRDPKSSAQLTCGVVLTGGITAPEYMKKRANDMQLIAQHKYGIRVKDHERFQLMMASLGRSASIVDMLESKSSSQIDLKSDKNKSSKGAAFILYNYARLSVLFKTLSNKQSSGYYPETPPLDTTDLTLLVEEDEWQLFWVYVAGFATMLKQAVGTADLSHISPHLVLSFTSALVICLSKYYRRVRILTENREHLLPTMFARIHLLKSVYHVLSMLLEIMDLEPVTQM